MTKKKDISKKKVKHNGAVDNLLRNHLIDLLTSISLCLENKLQLPALILIYSTIDMLAHLNRPKNNQDGARKNYCIWCDKYILPNTEDIHCDSIDLYAARCALLHTYGYKAALTESGQARIVAYAWGDKSAKKMKLVTELTSFKDTASHVHINKLAHGLSVGIDIFMEDILKDPAKHELVKERSKEFFVNFSF